MNTFTKTTSILAVLMLTACGGGGGGSDSSSGAAQVDEPVASNDSEATEQASVQVPLRSMQDLAVPDDFDYNPTKTVDVLVDISGISTQRAYISVYSEFQESADGTLTPDYAYRIANGALDSGKGEINITYAQEYTSLLAEIWFYDGTEPLQRVISRENSEIAY
ncbi:hypothetical protein AB4343_07960 [Vibrio breoganii]|uniref:Lipoprotein n=1 Tax=Vibrio breoganii TaxID=553239 RepID=A0AAP8MZB0_9VIBR|nr:hypothetical protein [Vibrio breoganii]PMP17030.1 hypothetical protein BCS93_00085 [Vibrio breoganii]TKG21908.1 hypothetical protein FCV81_08290 [Vibrio breoganii]